ncbi:MAG: Gx transporter family protein [Clostridiales bacterium]|nr:Gx transporter family protein [Clostridiales bacterium]
MNLNKTKKIAIFSILVALAFILSYIEVSIPNPFPIPGIKLGLANLVVITAFYTLGNREALIISLVRIVLVGFTFGNMSMMIYSMAGGLLSWLIMFICKKFNIFSIVGISVVGGLAHNIGQVAVAVIMVENMNIIYILPILLISGVAAGTIIGILGGIMVKRLQGVLR